MDTLTLDGPLLALISERDENIKKSENDIPDVDKYLHNRFAKLLKN